MPPQQDSERQPLLSHNSNDDHSNSNTDGDNRSQKKQKVEFSDNDKEDPRQWSLSVKYWQTFQIFVLAFICPMASSAFAPAIGNIASEFNASKKAVLAGQTGFVCMLGFGPLILAPMSETFGRRIVFLTNLAVFTLLQVATALSPNVVFFIVIRTLSGFFGSVGVANGGGSISDMFETRERAPVLGCYLVAPLLGPTIGPLIGGLIVSAADWRWIFWLITILAGTATVICYFCLYETRAITLLEMRKSELEKKNEDVDYEVEGVGDSSIAGKIAANGSRAVRILTTQPIVMIMSLYQALIFSTMYSLYAEYTEIWSSAPYNFNITQVSLTYLGPAVGFIVTAFFTVFFIDRVYNWQCKHYDSDGQPEFRLPLANIGAFFLPISLFWFGWTVEKQFHWAVPIAATLFFGASQVSIFNTVQTFYIDAYESNAASALAAGAFLRSMFGGIIPLLVGGMFDILGYGWGMSVFGFLSVILMPAPTLFYIYGETLRKKYPFKG